MRFGTKYGFGQSPQAGPYLNVVRIKFDTSKNRKKRALFCFSAEYIEYGDKKYHAIRYWTKNIWLASSAQEAHRISTAIERKERIKSEIKAR